MFETFQRMRRIKILISLFLLTSAINSVLGQATQESLQFSKEISKTINFGYLLYLPPGNNDAGTEKFPLLLFLHGSGERGTDLDLVKKNGPPKVAEQMELPFIILSPQCPEVAWWDVDGVKVLLDEIIATYPVDKSRIYITGLSMGGFGTWDMIIKYPDVFAAAIPVCGAGYPFRLERIKNLPVWAFHGQKDDVVPIEYSQKMVDALKRANGNIKFTIYPEANHDSWTETYNNPEVYQWLLQQKRTVNY